MVAALLLCAAATSTAAVQLPVPQLRGDISLEQVIAERRSIRSFLSDPITLGAASQLLWAAQGITAEPGRRSAPSAGAIYPLTIYLFAGSVSGLEAGVYRYLPDSHRLEESRTGDLRQALVAAAGGQEWIRESAAVLLISADPARSAVRYGGRATRFVTLEAGHAAQNVLLQAVALGLGAVPVGAFGESAIRRLAGLPSHEVPLYLIPVGHPAPGG